jgi:hypothetical protein
VALTLMARAPHPAPASHVTTKLVDVVKIDVATAAGIVADLRTRHVIDDNAGDLSLTPAGSTLFDQLSDEITRLTDEMWAGLSADDLAVAYRVHTTITARANALLGRLHPIPSPGASDDESASVSDISGVSEFKGD